MLHAAIFIEVPDTIRQPDCRFCYVQLPRILDVSRITIGASPQSRPRYFSACLVKTFASLNPVLIPLYSAADLPMTGEGSGENDGSEVGG